MRNHSPGPWHVETIKQRWLVVVDVEDDRLVVLDAEDDIVCDVWPNDTAEDARREANARLLATAPELLAACNEVRAHLAHALTWRPNESEQRLLDLLTQVIATATGKVTDE